MQRRWSKCEGYEITKKIMKVVRINKGKNVKWKYKLKNNLIVFTYYLKLFFTLSYNIKLFTKYI